MTIVVTGGRGTLGSLVVNALPNARAVSRATGTDLLKRTGLEALNADVIVHCATQFRRETDLMRTALDARPQHLIYVSIVGVDKVPFTYYREKLAAEQLLTNSGVPWTILRATQFHPLLKKIFDYSARLPLVLVPDFRFQPIDPAEVAAELKTLAQRDPAGMAPEMGGPEIRHAKDLAQAYLNRRAHPIRLPGKTFRAYRAGGNLTPDRAVGRKTFEQYLSE